MSRIYEMTRNTSPELTIPTDGYRAAYRTVPRLAPRVYFLLISILLAGGISIGRCDAVKAASLVITAYDVATNSIRIAPPPAMTNVYANFRFEGKSPEEIKALVGPNVMKPVVIAGNGSTTLGIVQGILVNSNNIPIGIVVSFETREDAKKAARSLRTRSAP